MVFSKILKIFSFLLFLVLSFKTHSSISFKSIPIAKTVEQSKDLFEQRKQATLSFWSNLELEEELRLDNNLRFNNVLLAYAYTGKNLNRVNEILLSDKVKPFGKVGTNFVVIPGLCERKGDYDFALQYLIRLAYIDLEKNILWPKTKQKLLDKLLVAKGSKHHKWFKLGICGSYIDTENHILMTETSRYLTNQLIHERNLKNNSYNKEFDNSKNGFNKWMINHLSEFITHYYDEYNSRPYQVYTMMALNNLYSYAYDEKVKTTAKMILDFTSGLFALQSNGLRRSVPFRRQIKYSSSNQVYQAEAEMPRFAMLAGNYEYLKGLNNDFTIPYGNHVLLGAAIGKYRIPDMLLDLMINKKDHNFFQQFKHQTVESYFSDENFLISGGGYYVNRLDGATKQNDGWAKPLVIIPTHDDSSLLSNWIRIKGHRQRLKRQNTCHYKNFGCGLNLTIPKSIPSSCKQTFSNWTFLNFDSDSCPIKLGFYVATFSKRCIKDCKNKADNFGLFEVVNSKTMNFEKFMNQVLYNNSASETFKVHSKNIYTTLNNEKIEFRFATKNLNDFEIIKINDQKLQKKFSKWNFLSGDILNSNGNGKVEIVNPILNTKMILDLTNQDQPIHEIIPF